MSLNSHTNATSQTAKAQSRTRLDSFPLGSIFTTAEQMQRFELLRLAFFVLKLRKLYDSMSEAVEEGMSENQEHEFSFQRNLLQHTIFHQVLTLTTLDARDQAMQIISACHNKK